ncbi:hypothetical protein MCOR12_006073 [Pyricularia oryzae]|nr:hypothetical protein MCOR12_006073 [Pyricularia oryzae]
MLNVKRGTEEEKERAERESSSHDRPRRLRRALKCRGAAVPAPVAKEAVGGNNATMQDPSVAQKNKIADVARSMQGCFETIEATIKIAKVYTGRFEIVAFSESYHDLAQGSGSATYSTGRRNGGPSMSGQPAFPAPTRTGPCSAGRTGHRQNVDSLTGFIMESILSTGGIVPPKGYLKRMAEDCRKRGRVCSKPSRLHPTPLPRLQGLSWGKPSRRGRSSLVSRATWSTGLVWVVCSDLPL